MMPAAANRRLKSGKSMATKTSGADRSASATQRDHPVYNVLRLQRGLGQGIVFQIIGGGRREFEPAVYRQDVSLAVLRAPAEIGRKVAYLLQRVDASGPVGTGPPLTFGENLGSDLDQSKLGRIVSRYVEEQQQRTAVVVGSIDQADIQGLRQRLRRDRRRLPGHSGGCFSRRGRCCGGGFLSPGGEAQSCPSQCEAASYSQYTLKLITGACNN